MLFLFPAADGGMMKFRCGEELRAARDSRGLTLREVAGRAGVSESLVSQIERNRVSPALDTLLRLAEVVQLDLAGLFSGLQRRRRLQLVRAEERTEVRVGDALYSLLSGTAGNGHGPALGAYRLELPPGGTQGDNSRGHLGRELGIIISGSGELEYQGERFTLGPGDSVSFAADVPHRLVNTGTEPLAAYWVTTPPRFPVEQEEPFAETDTQE